MSQEKPQRWRLLVASAAIIALATLTPRGGEVSSVGWCVLCGTRGLSDFLSNVLLFMPFGFALGMRGWSTSRAGAVAASISIVIELMQLTVVGGRDPALGDVVANTLGGALGGFLGCRREWWLREDTGRDWVAACAVALVVLLVGLALLTPSLPRSTWYMQWTARFASMGTYNGQVTSTRIGPLSIPDGVMENSDSVRQMLLHEPLEFQATADVPHGIAPIVSIADHRQRHVMMLSADRLDLVYWHRTIADRLRLDRGDFRVHRAFEVLEPGESYTLRWTADRAGYCLELGERQECGRGFTVGDTWTLLMSLDWGTDERTVLRAVWLWLVFVPAGMLMRRPAQILAGAGLVAIVLGAVPWLMGFALTPGYQLAAAGIGLASGYRFIRSRVKDMGRKE